MEKKRALNAEELLEEIFFFMNRLIEEKDFDQTILLLTDLGRTLVNSDRASFWYWDQKKKQYWTIVALGSERITVEEGDGIVGASIAGNETIVLNDPRKDPRFYAKSSEAIGYPVHSLLCMPVTDTRGRVIGAYQAVNKLDAQGDQGAFDETDVRRLALAAVYCGKALESHILYGEAQLDPLTGLKNRRGMYDYCFAHFSGENVEDSSVIMCDIDFFKKVNDTYGHNAGDAELVHIAKLLQQGLPQGGQVIRWGGEEFILLLEHTDWEAAVQLAQTLRERVEQSVCRFEDQEIRVTMSFGVSKWDRELTSDENIKGVDQKLYKAKTTGRNRVVAE